MSRIPQPSGARGAPPRTGGIPRPSQTFRPAASSTRQDVGGDQSAPTVAKTPSTRGPERRPCPSTKKPKAKEAEYVLPALSTLRRVEKDDETEFERLKRKTARRNAPEGEDLGRIKEIMKSIKDQDITVHEFVGLVAPYTADNGTILRTVLATELSQFRNLARKVYDTMTQDVGDVLTNEHIQLTESSKEKHSIYGDKMMRAIDEIYEYFPNFDFEKYYTDPEYLNQICPLRTKAPMDEVEEQNLLRQEAYHRMMWLRSEGERLQTENKKLHERLYELKLRQKEELQRAADIEKDKEHKRIALEQTQGQLQDQLNELNSSLEKTLVEEEIGLADLAAAQMPPPPTERKSPLVAPKPTVREPERWNVRAAAEIEETTTTEALIAETSRVSLASSKASTGAIPKQVKPKKKKKRRTSQLPPQDTSPFHYSPPRTPPEERRPSRQETSPFHYSPPRTPSAEARQASPFHYSPPRGSPPRSPSGLRDQAEGGGGMETTRITTTTRTLEQPPPCSNLPRPRRSLAPRDTWQGF